jgi:hypothetical protein
MWANSHSSHSSSLTKLLTKDLDKVRPVTDRPTQCFDGSGPRLSLVGEDLDADVLSVAAPQLLRDPIVADLSMPSTLEMSSTLDADLLDALPSCLPKTMVTMSTEKVDANLSMPSTLKRCATLGVLPSCSSKTLDADLLDVLPSCLPKMMVTMSTEKDVANLSMPSTLKRCATLGVLPSCSSKMMVKMSTEEKAVVCLQSQFRKSIAQERQRTRIQKEGLAATIISLCARMMFARNRFAAQEREMTRVKREQLAVTLISSWTRMTFVKNRFIKMVHFIVRLQGLARRLLAMRKLTLQLSQKKRWKKWLRPNEWVLLEGQCLECSKKRFTLDGAKRRTLILTNFPRILYFSTHKPKSDLSAGMNESPKLKGEILLTIVRAVTMKLDDRTSSRQGAQQEDDLGSFDVVANGHTFSWACLSTALGSNPGSKEWVEKLEPLVKATAEITGMEMVHEGFLIKRGMSQFKTWHRRHFELFQTSDGGVLRYSTDSNHSGTVKGNIKLSITSIVRSVDHSKPHCFELVTGDMQSDCTLVCSSGSDQARDEWVRQIYSVIRGKSGGVHYYM